MEAAQQPHKRVSCLGQIKVGVTVLVAVPWLIVLVGRLLPHQKPPQAMEKIPWTEGVRFPVVLSLRVVALLWALWRSLGAETPLVLCGVSVAAAVSWPPRIDSPVDFAPVFVVAGPLFMVRILSMLRAPRALQVATASEEVVPS